MRNNMEYEDYEADKEYAKEVYWESKGLGNSNPDPDK
jgi:hypothetical protein